MIDKELLEILACPACGANVKLKEEKIICTGCGRQYPTQNSIPVMLIEKAKVLKREDFN